MEHSIRGLLAAIDVYLQHLDGPGIDAVRAGLARAAPRTIQPVQAQAVAACRWLDESLRLVAEGGQVALAEAIAPALPYLAWTVYDPYPRALIGAAFADHHGFASLIGEGGFLRAGDFDLGLFLIGPNIFYRDHRHAAPELYAPLTGPHGWRFNPADRLTWKPAHAPVWSEPWQPHATMTGRVPFLSLYCWTRDVSTPAEVIVTGDWRDMEIPA